MRGPGKLVDADGADGLVACAEEGRQVAREALRLAGDVKDAVDTVGQDLREGLRVNAVTRRIEHNDVGLLRNVL